MKPKGADLKCDIVCNHYDVPPRGKLGGSDFHVPCYHSYLLKAKYTLDQS